MKASREAGLTGDGVFSRAPLDLRFAMQKTLDPRVTHTRASSATFVDSSGVLQRAVTNLALRSEEFNDASWGKVNITVTANSIAAPNGTVTADTITDSNDASAAVHSATSQNQSFTSGLSYTVSIYARAGTQPGIAFVLPAAAFTSNLTAVFNISTGAIVSFDSGMTGSITAVGGGWYRCTATATATATASSSTVIQFRIATASTSFYQGNGTGTISLWGAQLEQASTVGDYVPTTSAINSAPRFDHNPTTGESLGLLVEEARTNSVTNNTMVGAVAGTPGTLPTGWGTFFAPTGLTRTIVGSGIVNGINYIDVRFNGTPSSTGEITLYLSPTTTAATLGQAWTASAWLSLAGGSTSNIAVIALRNFELNSGAYVRETSTNFISSISSDFIRRQHVTSSFGASANQIQSVLTINAAAGGTPIDITLRIGMPQLELGAFATSVIPTVGAGVITPGYASPAVTRAADVASITGSNFGATRTNLLLRSGEFDNAGTWTSTLVTAANAITAPDGTLTGDTFTVDAGLSESLYQAVTCTASTVYTFSFYVRLGTLPANDLRVAIRDDTGAAFIISDSLPGVIPVTTEWRRVSFTFTTPVGCVLVRPYVYRYTSGSGGTFSAWGAQLETGSTATAYIPTTTAAVSVFESSWYNQTEGTLYHQGRTPTAANFFSIDDGTVNNRITSYMTSATAPLFFVATGGATQANISSSAITAGSLFTQASAFRANDFVIVTDGGTVSTDTSGSVPTVNRMVIGSNNFGSAVVNGTIKRLTFWPVRLANTTLQQITQP